MILLFAGNENNTSDRQLSETLYRAALDAYLENTKRRVSGKDCERTAGVHGKPAAAGLPGFHFNISHSGGIGVCALSDRPVGADLQRIPKDPACGSRGIFTQRRKCGPWRPSQGVQRISAPFSAGSGRPARVLSSARGKDSPGISAPSVRTCKKA